MKAQAEAESRPPVYTGRWAHASPEEVEQEKAKVSVSWLIVHIYPRMCPASAWGMQRNRATSPCLYGGRVCESLGEVGQPA